MSLYVPNMSPYVPNMSVYGLYMSFGAGVQRAVVTSSVGAIMGSFREKEGYFDEVCPYISLICP